ncbi:MAG: hypothetical protein LBV12_11385 [Puniceicoccales bacterium]|jgi:hypothetical protein|nr:hypothetical protein [Puniceicoccales bacterium]
MAASSLPPVPVPAVPRDFPDRINPIIVKEVRQGLRGYFFVGGFMLLHLVLVMWVFFAGVSQTSSGGSSGADFVFWVIFVAGLFTLTVRMQGSVRGEQRANTLELLQLTQQTPWRIATGKWSANMMLALLFIVSLLPYGMLRYFVGTFSLVPDAVAILCLFCATGVFSALYLYASCLPKGIGIVLNIVLGGIAAAAVYGAMELFQGTSTGLRGVFSTNAISHIVGVIGGIVGYSLLYILLFLFMTAGRVALGTEQVAFRKRLIGWIILLPVIGAAIFNADKSLIAILMFACFPVLLIVLDAILTPTSASVPVFSAFGRRKILGRVAVFLFGPSQSCGILYAIITLLMFLWIPFGKLADGGSDSPAIILAVINSFLLPLALAQLFSGQLGKFPLYIRYWGFYACQWLFLLICYVVGNVLTFADSKLITCISPAGVFMNASGLTWFVPTAFSVVHLVFILAVLGGFLLRDLSAVRKMLKGERADIPAI